MAQPETLGQILEGDDIARYFGQFVLAGDARAQKIAADPAGGWQNLPQSTAEVLSDVKEIWQEKGFLTPAALRAELMEKYMGDADGALKNFVQEVELSRNALDPATGYLGKEHAYTATGLAHLYAVETGKPMTMVEVDFSNMGGTNNYFREKLARERNVPLEGVPEQEAMGMTDLAMRVLCQSMTETLTAQLPKGASIVPIRTGGDELRILVTGIDNAARAQEISDLVHMGIEKHVAAMGLQDHLHLKAPEDPRRNGFGAAVALQDMGSIANTHNLIQELDSQIKTTKNAVGAARIGRIDAEIETEVIHAKIASGDLTVPPGTLKEDFVESELARRGAQAAVYADYLHSLNPRYNRALDNSVKGFLSYTQAYLDPGAAQPGIAAMLDATGTDAPPMTGVTDRRIMAANGVIAGMGVKPTGAQQFLAEMAVAGLAAEDPSAQTLMPQTVVQTVSAWAKDAAAFREQHDPAGKAVKHALYDAGMEAKDLGTPFALVASFHNLGGLNGLLGHHNSDVVLRQMGRMIGESLEAAGVPGGDAKAYAVAHNGGACFTAVIKPGVTGADGKPVFISEQQIEAAQKEIERRVEALNDTNIADFLQKNGVEVDADLRAHLAKENAGTFRDVKDPKKRETDVDGAKIAGRVPGLGVGLSHHAFPDDAAENAQQFMSEIKHSCDRRVEDYRKKVIVIGHVADMLKDAGCPEGAPCAHPEMNHPKNAHMARLYSLLPSEATPDMPPEVQSLIAHKGLIEKAQQDISSPAKGTVLSQGPWAQKLEKSFEMFRQQYDELAQGGGLLQVGQHLKTMTSRFTPGPAVAVVNTANLSLPRTKFGSPKPGGGIQ